MGVGFMAAQVAQEKRAGADEVANEMILLKSDTNDGAEEGKVQAAFDDAMQKADAALAKGDKATADKYINKARAAARLAGRRKDTAARFAEATLLNSKKSYNATALGKIAKEISEGETAKSYRSGSPFTFEYASQLNQGTAMGADGKTPAKNYADWLANRENVHASLDHHVTTSDELMGVQGKNLQQMVDMINAGKMNGYDVGYLRTLSQKAIRTHKENGTSFDISKAESIYRLAYGDGEYRDKMKADGIGNLIKSSEVRGADSGSGAARAEEVFDVQGAPQPVAQQAAPVTGPQPQTTPVRPVEVPVRQQQTVSTNEHALDVRALEDETLLDIATNPNAQNSDATRTAAEQEYLRRNPGFKGSNQQKS